MPELCLRKIFPRVLLLNSNFPEKYFKIFKKKNVIEVPVNSTDLFQLNMIDRYLDHPNENFKNGEYKVIDKLCFTGFLSLYYFNPKLFQNGNDCQPVN